MIADTGTRVNTVNIRQMWEHHVVTVNVAGVFAGKMKTDPINQIMQDMGRDGWELVSTFQGSNVKASLPGLLLFFKRPVFMGV